MSDKYIESMADKLKMDLELIVEKRVSEAIAEKNREIKELRAEMADMFSIRKDSSGVYLNINDFLRVTKSLLAFEPSKTKQYLYSTGILDKEDGVYIANKNSTLAKCEDGELYVKDSYLRRLLALRTMTAIGSEKDLNTFVQKFNDKRDIIMETMSNTVYIEYKQNSFEFRNMEGSQYDLLEK